MRTAITMILFGAGWLLQMFGGITVVVLLIYGIYALFAKSVIGGLVLIGASVVLGWVIRFFSGLLMLAGAGAATIGAKRSEEN
ncbi:MAG: hypothetical protein JNK28_03370 [Burkholderiaceae bacterium]|nr:hypothetical protein [Burkholderiaceae bacterium]